MSRKRLGEIYRTMLRIRRFEETADDLYMAGKVVGGVHVSIGQEAVFGRRVRGLKRR